MNSLAKAINTLEHISTTNLPASQMRRIIRETLLELYKYRNEKKMVETFTPEGRLR
jgi:hypothetical protein